MSRKRIFVEFSMELSLGRNQLRQFWRSIQGFRFCMWYGIKIRQFPLTWDATISTVLRYTELLVMSVNRTW